MPRSNETVLDGVFTDTDVSLVAAATTLVRIGGGGCVTEQQLTSEISSGFVGSRISLRGIGTGLGFDLMTSALRALWSSPLPPNGPVAGAGDDAVVPAAVVEVAAGCDGTVSSDVVAGEVVGASSCVRMAAFVRNCSVETETLIVILMDEAEINTPKCNWDPNLRHVVYSDKCLHLQPTVWVETGVNLPHLSYNLQMAKTPL